MSPILIAGPSSDKLVPRSSTISGLGPKNLKVEGEGQTSGGLTRLP